MRKIAGLGLFLLILAGCGNVIDIEGIYLLESYDGENSDMLQLVDQIGYAVQPYEREEGEKGYAFLPIVVINGELNLLPDSMLSDPPWRLLESKKNKYTLPLPLDKMYFWDAKVKGDALVGKLRGLDESGSVRFKKMETE